MQDKKVSQSEIIKHLCFEERLCHECNRATPFYRYCHEMYGGAFKQNYGWYIKKQGYEWGIEGVSYRLLSEACPEEILALIKQFDLEASSRKYGELHSSEDTRYSAETRELGENLAKHNRKIWNVVENEVRRKFGHKKIGEAWTSETILYYIVKKLYPRYTVHRHYRPDFLQGLELDIYIEELNVGIEYQGVQHFRPISHWGGKQALQEVRERDHKKKEICEAHNIPIVYFRYDEGLDDGIVYKRIQLAVE